MAVDAMGLAILGALHYALVLHLAIVALDHNLVRQMPTICILCERANHYCSAITCKNSKLRECSGLLPFNVLAALSRVAQIVIQ